MSQDMAEKTPPHIGATPVIAYFSYIRIIEEWALLRQNKKSLTLIILTGRQLMPKIMAKKLLCRNEVERSHYT